MSQNIKLPDDLYNDLKTLADKECRTVPLQIQFMVQNWGVEKNKTQNPVWAAFNSSDGVGSQANNNDLEEALGRFKQISEDLKPEALMRWCHKQSVDEAWSDEQAKIEVDKRTQELLAERNEVASILNEHGMAIGM
jgi:hypothetical protein